MIITCIMNLTIILLGISYVFLLIRLIKGPSSPDRVVAFDLISVTTVAFIMVVSVLVNESIYIDIAIALALVGFLGTIACARYVLLEKGGKNAHRDV